METLKKFTKWTHVLYKGFHTFINIALITIIVLQSLIFIVEFNDSKIKVPEFLLTKIRKILLDKQILFDANDITLKLNGEVNFEDLKITHSYFSEPIITCDHLKCNLNLLSLLFGKLNPEEILIRNASLLFPASLTPSGLNEPLIENFFGAISFGRRHTRIEQFDFDFQNIAVIADGSWSNSKHRFADSFNFDLPDYLSLSTTLLKIKDQLSLLDRPILAIRIRENEKGSILFDLNMAASGFAMDQIKLGPLHIKSALLYQNQKITTKNPLEISAENINWNNKELIAQSAQTQVTINSNGTLSDTLSLIKKLKITLNKISTHNLDIDSAEIGCDLSNNVIIPSTISLLHNNNWLSIKGNIDLEKKSIDGFIKGSSKLSELKTIASQFINQDLSKYKFDGQINWRGLFQAHQNEGIHIDKSKLVITSNELSYNDVHTDRVYAEINLSSDKLNIPYISIEGGENYAKGSISQNFKTGDYRYLLTGAIIPESLNSCLGNWWKELIAKYKFTAPMPFGNMDVQGNLSDTSKWIVFGEVQANNFDYSGIPLKELSLRINSNERELELIDLHAESMKGSLEAYTRFEYDKSPPHEGVVYTFVDGSSSLALNELDTILGLPGVHNVMTEFSPESTPNLKVHGEIYSNDKAKTHINLACSTDKEISYHNIPFENLSFSANYTPSKITINNIVGGFAKGTGKGSLIVTPTENSAKPNIKANLQLASVNQEMAVGFLQPLWERPDQKKKKANNYGGLINLDMQTTGILGDWNSFTGSGKVSITQATLGKIYLLWILSEILSPLMFGLGTLQLTDATSDFVIGNNAIHFPNINIYGSTVSIDGEGNFYLGSQNLDFILDISPMNKNGIPILSQALLVLTPITQSFQMHLGGTLYDPKWETMLTPLGLFKKKGPGIPTKN